MSYCSDCIHAFFRVIEIQPNVTETFTYCDIDGTKQTNNLVSCSAKEVKQEKVKPVKEYRCDICGKVVSSPLALAGHKRSHIDRADRVVRD